MGASDPISGHSVSMEILRGLHLLMKEGWRPRRSIIFCSWDAEEYGLEGSTEFLEKTINKLREQAVIYLNLDIAVEVTKKKKKKKFRKKKKKNCLIFFFFENRILVIWIFLVFLL